MISRKSTIGLAIPQATTRSGEIFRRAEYGRLKNPKTMLQEADRELYVDKLQSKAPVATHSG